MDVSKLYKVGSSVVMVIPRELRESLDWKRGDYVVLQKQPDKKTITVKKVKSGNIKQGMVKDEEK